MNKVLVFILILFGFSTHGQVKIGDNPSSINSNSILELESSTKVFVLSRLTNTQMLAIQPLHGALVYNTDQKCIFMFEGVSWRSLCNKGTTVTTSTTAPTLNNMGDMWVNNTTTRNVVSVWDGTKWIPINSNPKSGAGDPNAQLNLNPQLGDIYVNETNGEIYIYNGTSWVNNTANSNVTASNGVTKSATNNIELGGALTKATTLTTNAANTLAITGLQTTTDVTTNEIVVTDKTTGVLKKMDAANLLREEEIVVTAADGQIQFSPPHPIVNPQQIDVYRNGVRIAFTVVNTTTIALEPEAVCYKDDKIRIVQFY